MAPLTKAGVDPQTSILIDLKLARLRTYCWVNRLTNSVLSQDVHTDRACCLAGTTPMKGCASKILRWFALQIEPTTQLLMKAAPAGPLTSKLQGSSHTSTSFRSTESARPRPPRQMCPTRSSLTNLPMFGNATCL